MTDPTRAQLMQVVIEAVRLVCGKPPEADVCHECGTVGVGALRDALMAAFGTGYGTRLIWGHDGNVTDEALRLFKEQP